MNPYSRTYLTDPTLWTDGASFMCKVSYADGGQAIVASGWHLRQIEFENKNVTFLRAPSAEIGFQFIDTQIRTRDHFWEDVERFEFEASLDENPQHTSTIEDQLAELTCSEGAKQLVYSVQDMVRRVSANRTDGAPIQCGSSGTSEFVDLLCQNLPARSGDSNEPLRILSRWCRVFQLDNGTITLYQPIEDSQLPNLRWPHNGIWLNRGEEYFLGKTDIGDICEAVKIPVKYQEYNLKNWRIEFEMWRNQPFQIVISEDSDEAAKRLSLSQQEVGILSDFVTTAFLSLRNLDHRSSNNRLVKKESKLHEYVQNHVALQKNLITEYRDMLEKASGLLADTAQSVQAVVNQERAETAERTSAFITYATAVFFIPSLIISFYSMTIIGTDESSGNPTTLGVFILCVISAVIGASTLALVRMARARSRKKRDR